MGLSRAARTSRHVTWLQVLRLKAPLLLPRVATADATIGGFTVRRGTVVLANNYVRGVALQTEGLRRRC